MTTSSTTPKALPPSPSSTRASRRLTPNFPPSLFILPFTSAEWSKAIADVKKDYTCRRFRPCVARCNDILGRLRDKTVVQPVYLIYLHFYAASSQESMAFALHHASPQRLNLLNQAKDHYGKASQLITTAAAIAATNNTTAKRRSLCGAVVDSPTSARASGLWTPSLYSESSSRATSISSIEDAFAVSAKLKKKRRRASCQSTASFEQSVEQARMISRPDSPTLGLSPLAGSTFQDLLDAMPSPPPGPPNTTPATSEAEDSDTEGSARRFSALLVALQSQITRHMSFVEADLAAISKPAPPTPTNLGLGDDERRSLELQARIERLRAGGWQRRRFDASRYQELRENAMADIYS
ncbi:hypothetical protein B0T10DRAFT_562248 [Thelonectria olida]|uniref:Uncharacterized protein n=1 Tax=Thelonectria olida TaxID=1576542 RepID=A0A9P8W5P1_9HYPO|nr:hypothetical protein B0T10DRAFT_562248 [Thelonectria olida]